ncbi:MAG: GNAT family N-acetyltransferase [Pseudoruegeria sp.]
MNNARPPLRYRPHHFLCSLGFEGKGYSDDFTANMTAIVMGRLRAQYGNGVIIEVVNQTDDICAPCPMRKDNLCTDEPKIAALDARHATLLGLSNGERLTWGEAQRRMRELVSPQDLNDACQGCQWLDLGVCQSALLRLKADLSDGTQMNIPATALHIRESNRLRLEPHSVQHLADLNRMNNTPEIMQFLGGDIPEPLERTEESINKIQRRWAKYGFGWWVLIEKTSDRVVGAACLQHLAHLESNPLEVGWRLFPEFQGMGYATEAGQAAIDYAFGPVGIDYLTAVTHPQNIASQKVMQRLGMTNIGEQIHYDEVCATYELHKPA